MSKTFKRIEKEVNRKLNASVLPSELDEAIVCEIRDAVEDLATANWPRIQSVLAVCEGKVTVAFSVSLDRTGKKPRVLTKIAFAEKHKDERDVYIEDPRQQTLPIDVEVEK